MITSPNSMLSGCVIWLDAADTTTLFQLSGDLGTGSNPVTANNNLVGCWLNKSLSATAFGSTAFTNVNGTLNTRPTFISSNTQNGLPCIRFNSNDDYLTSYFNIAYTSQTVIMVFRPISANWGRIYTQFGVGENDTVPAHHYIPIHSSNNTDNANSYASGSFNQANVTLRGSSFYDIFVSRHSGSQIQNYRNGSVTATFTHNLSTLNIIGSRICTAGSNNFSGDVCELIVYNRALSNAERCEIEWYLSQKWNIPRRVFPYESGDWNTLTWSVSGFPSPWNLPMSADTVHGNGKIVQNVPSVRVSEIRNDQYTLGATVAGGNFMLANNTSLTAAIVTGTTTCVVVPSSFDVEIIGTITGSVNTSQTAAVSCVGNNSLITKGSISGGGVGGNPSNAHGVVLRTGVGKTSYIFSTIRSGGNNNGSNTCHGLINESGGDVYVNTSTITGTGGGSGGSDNYALVNSSTTTGMLSVICPNMTAGSWSYGINNLSTATVYITGVASNGSSAGYGAVRHNSSGIMYFTGQARAGIGDAGYGVSNDSNGTLYVTGTAETVTSGGGVQNTPGLRNNSSGTLYFYGDVVSSRHNTDNHLRAPIACHSTGLNFLSCTRFDISSNGPCIYSTCTTTVSVFANNVVNAPNGRQTIYARRYRLFPLPTTSLSSSMFVRHAVNGYDSYVDYWPSTTIFTYPAVSNVNFNTIYGNSLTGTMIIPPVTSVNINVAVGPSVNASSIESGGRYRIEYIGNADFTTIGAPLNVVNTVFVASGPITNSTGRVYRLGITQPTFTADSFWNQSVNVFGTIPNSLGYKMRGNATYQALSGIISQLKYRS